MQFLITTPVLPKDTTQPFLTPDEIVAGPFLKKVWRGDKVAFVGTPCGNCDYKATIAQLPATQKPDVLVSFTDGTDRCRMVNLPDNLVRFLFVSGTTLGGNALSKALEYAVSGKFKGVFVSDRQHAHFFREVGIPNVFWIPGLTPGCINFVRAPSRKNTLLYFDRPEKYTLRQRELFAPILQNKLPIAGGPQPMYEGLQLLSGASIGICISENGEFNHHIFETACAGAMILGDKLSPMSGLDLFFREGESIVTYENCGDLLMKAANYFAHEAEAAKIAAKGREIYDRYFSSQARRRTIMNILEGKERDSRYFLMDEPRCRLAPGAKPVAFDLIKRRVLFYEYLQAMGAGAGSVTVDFVSGESPQVIADSSDLLRVSVRLKPSCFSENDRLPALLEALGARFSIDEAPLSGGDVLVVGSSFFGGSDAKGVLESGAYKHLYVLPSGAPVSNATTDGIQRMGFNPVAECPGLFKIG
jgi:hypothetical protein